MNDIKLILCDLDGTILNDKKEIPSRFYEVFSLLKEKGIRMGMASGRPLCNIEMKFPDVKEQLCNVCENGGCVTYDGEVIHLEKIAKEKCDKVIVKVREIGNCGCVLCALNATYIENSDDIMVEKCKEYYPNLVIVDDLCKVEDDILKVSVFDFIDSWTNAAPQIQGIDPELDSATSGHDWVDVMNKGVSKAKGIELLCQHMNISISQVMAFGDEMNDYEMLQLVPNSIAMKNAVDAVKAVCSQICESNNNDGVMKKIIETFDLSI